MEPEKLTYDQLLKEVTQLRDQLEEANDTIDAIRTGKIDALIVQGDEGHQLYTLKTADQTYRMFIEKMNEGAVTLNHDGIILYSNSRFAGMVNMPLEKVIGLPFENFIAVESHETFSQTIQKAWEAECKEEIELLGNDNEPVSCLLSCNTLELDEGLALSLILTDLTIQKNAERQLKIRNIQLAEAQSATEKLNDELEDTVRDRTADLLISREHFKLLADSIPQMTWTNLQNGEFNFYNRRWYDYTGTDPKENSISVWIDVLHPDDIKLTTDRFWTALRNGTVFELENRYKRHDGVYRWHLNRAVPLRDDEGKILFWVGTATDIEEQRQQMEKKDEFIGIASHELRTPLTSLKGYLQLIGHKKDTLPEGIRQYVDKALTSLNKLQRLVNDLLDVSKIQAGRLEYGLQPVDISEMIRSCVENARHVYPSFTIESNLQTGLVVNGNEERLEQVLMNFINNAVKYSPNHRTVTVKAEKLETCARVSVTDNGIGLSAGQREKIFERFYRVEDKKYMSSGLGMGLYISQEIINNHRGKIGVESQLGEGSTFYFELPLA